MQKSQRTTKPILGLFLLLVTSAAVIAADRVISQTIPLPNVEGRIDHMAFDPAGHRLFLAALGNNTLEIIDVEKGKVAGRIDHLSEPQGVAFLPDFKQLIIANGEGNSAQIRDSDSLKLLKTIDGLEDADNVRYDPKAKLAYVGYGSGKSSGIAVIDPQEMGKIRTIALDGHPESFQLETNGTRIFVNVPNARHIAVIDRQSWSVTARWELKDAQANFPMALDEEHHRLFIGCRKPAKVLDLDTRTGQTIASVDVSGDTDDLFFDGQTKQVYASCGQGTLDIIDVADTGQLHRTLQVPTAPGARTSLLVPSTHVLYIAVPHRADHQAQVISYRMQ
jgi:DNA-binding beta-propeller fold protein YncE